MPFESDEYSKRALDFVERLQRLKTYDEICKHILKELAQFGFNYLTSFSIPQAGQSFKDCMWFNNRPQDYIERYSSQNYVLKDPVVTELRKNLNPYSWSDVRRTRELKKSEVNIIDEAREWGSRDGMMLQIVTNSGLVSCFCPCGLGPDLSPRARTALEVIAIYSHHALRRALVQNQRDDVVHIPLTPREREIMQWVAVGKTDDEIGEILLIASTTVTQHVENAKRKLDALRRTYAVVQAIRFGEISL
ncbi:MAG: autoinducer binding domain-containing protein [Proteobacteria bacterium]|nr:autoinducer binding domain-containing protein [Pseudomonadota bacterium]